MTTLSTGISTTSMFLTPQAVDDFFAMGEDMVSVCIDVLSNDLGGNAKTLWATTTGSELNSDGTSALNTTEVTDLQTRDVVGCYETTELGAKVAITSNGMLSYCVTPIQGMLNALAAGEWVTDHITYTIRLSNGTLSIATLTVTILGSNDGIRIGVKDLAGGVTEDGHAPALLETDQGSIFFTDVDASDTHTVSSLANGTGYLGDFETTMPADSTGGATGEARWNFSVANADIQYLGAGDHLDQSYTVRIDDGHGSLVEEVVTVRIQGVNDGVEIGPADDLGGVTEDADASIPPDGADEDQTAEGSIAFADADLSDVHLFDVEADAGNATALGTFTLEETVDSTTIGTGRIDWRFVVANELIQHLGENDSETLVYHVTIDDQNGSVETQDVTITIQGVNDLALISENPREDQDYSVRENGYLENGDSAAAGELDVDDADQGEESFRAVDPDDLLGAYGDFSFDEATGAWTYTLNDALAVTQELNDSDRKTETMTVWSLDGTDSFDIEVTVQGSNDAATISENGVQDNSVTELGVTEAGDSSAGGDLDVSDVDSDETFLVQGSLSGTYGDFTFVEATGAWTYTLDDTLEATQALNTGDLGITETLTVTSADGTDSYEIVVNVAGSNDAAVLSSADVSKNETNAALSFSGTLTNSDVDSDDTFQVQTDTDGDFGKFSIDVNGNWTYVADAAFDELNLGGSHSDTFTVLAADGTETSVTVRINGTNDAPTATAIIGSVGEDGPYSVNLLTAAGAADVDSATLSAVNAEASMTTTGGRSLTLDTHYTVSGASFALTAAGLQLFNDLNSGQTDTFVFDYDVSDGSATTANTLTVTVNGADEPVTVITVPAVVTGADPNDNDSEATATSSQNLTGNQQGNVLRGSAFADTITGNNGDDTIYGGAGNDSLNGDENNDLIYGGSGADIINGGNNNDTLYGGSGNDTITAGNNTDRLIGGYGADRLTGQAGTVETFVFLSVSDTGDTITNFETTVDKIDLSAIDANGADAGDPALTWNGTSATANGVWYASSGGVTTIYVDTNGSPAGAEMVIYLTGTYALTAADFLI